MKKSVVVGITIIAIIFLVVLSYFLLFSKKDITSEIFCHIDSNRIKLSEPYPGVLAHGKQIGSESYKFVNGETISVCCAEVTSSDNRDFKDCIQYVSEDVIGDYHVSWEKKNGQLVKILEEVIWQGNNCFYYFDETGQWTRTCDGIKEYIGNIMSKEELISECDKSKDQYSKDECYEDVALELLDSSICNYKNDNKDWCSDSVDRVSVAVKTAIEKNDISICSQGAYGFEINWCYFGVAKELKDSSVCDEISFFIEREKCQSLFN